MTEEDNWQVSKSLGVEQENKFTEEEDFINELRLETVIFDEASHCGINQLISKTMSMSLINKQETLPL